MQGCVVVEPFLCRCLREHQRQGVQFMYECVTGLVRGLLVLRVALPVPAACSVYSFRLLTTPLLPIAATDSRVAIRAILFTH